MPKIKGKSIKAMYWWNASIEELRRKSLKARRAMQRCRQRTSSTLEEDQLNIRYMVISDEL